MMVDATPRQTSANFRPLTPLDFLDRAVEIFPTRTAVIWGDRSWNYAEFAGIVTAMIDTLRDHAIGPGDVVAILCGNRPEMLAAHYAVPALGATLNTINTRLDVNATSYILSHSGARIVFADPAGASVAGKAGKQAGVPCIVFSLQGTVGDGLALLGASPITACNFSAMVEDEFRPIALNYTSGTTGKPKGVLLNHRGAYLNAIGNVMSLGFDAQTVYLWTLPMFHVNGWCHTWAVTAAGGVHVCLDKVIPDEIFRLIDACSVTHMACAPVVLYMLLSDPARKGHDPSKPLRVASGGAAPTSALISEMEALGFEFIHMYGLTESFGPTTMRQLAPDEMSEASERRAQYLSLQGVRHITANIVKVVDDKGRPVPADGSTMGEIVLRGNTVMLGYHQDPLATQQAFAGGFFHTGDIAVLHPDGQIEIRDRAKDLIISGGENISSLEIEQALHSHPEVLMAAVVAAPDAKWGEVPCAFIEARPGSPLDEQALLAFCRERLARFKVPRLFVFAELPKTATGKIQKFALRKSAQELVTRHGKAQS